MAGLEGKGFTCSAGLRASSEGTLGSCFRQGPAVSHNSHLRCIFVRCRGCLRHTTFAYRTCCPAGRLAEAAAEGEQLKASLEASTAQCADLEQRVATLDAELAAARTGLEGKEGQLAQRGAELEATAAELAAAREQVASLSGGLGQQGSVR